MSTILILIIIAIAAAIGYSFYLHKKISNLQQVIDDLKNLVKPV